MTLTKQQVTHIARLARLDLSAEEIDTYCEQLSQILEHFARLEALDTTHIPPTSSVLQEETSLRQDEPQPGLSTQALLQNAPDTVDNQFRVPPVLE